MKLVKIFSYEIKEITKFAAKEENQILNKNFILESEWYKCLKIQIC